MRFELAYCNYEWWAIKDNDTGLVISGEKVVEIMNELEKELEKQKKNNGRV